MIRWTRVTRNNYAASMPTEARILAYAYKAPGDREWRYRIVETGFTGGPCPSLKDCQEAAREHLETGRAPDPKA